MLNGYMAHLTALDEGRVCVLDYLDGNNIYSVISSSHIPLRHTNLCPALWAGQIRSVIVHESGLLKIFCCSSEKLLWFSVSIYLIRF